MAANHIQEPLIDARALARTVLCLLLAIQAGCASHREIHALEPGGSGSADTLAIIPFRSHINWGGAETDIRHAICEALSGRRGSYAVAIQPEADTDERLRAAGWRPSSAPWGLVLGHIETDSSTYLCRLLAYPRFLVSHNLLSDSTYADPLREWLGPMLPGSLLILAEAHHAAPGHPFGIQGLPLRASRRRAHETGARVVGCPTGFGDPGIRLHDPPATRDPVDCTCEKASTTCV